MTSRKIAVVGLGYVGLPVAVAFGKSVGVVGFDINARRIAELKEAKDCTGEVESSELRASKINYTSEVKGMQGCDFYIVAVPTPVDDAHRPDLSLMVRASESVGQVLKKGDIVVYESTVYPGVTEKICVPVLEKISGLKFNQDFEVGYSPERINPGDKEHTFTKIQKVVSGSSAQALDIVAEVYSSVVTAGVHRAGSIQAAEMAKVIENTQRDINIALMNEVALICDKIGLETREVIKAAQTKWNFLKFVPGLVGGHCIGVDPYYLTHLAETLGYHPEVILSGRRINDGMGKFIASKTVKELLRLGHPVKDSFVSILGLTFKENCPDIRNSRVIDVVRELSEYGVRVQVCDPLADPRETFEEYGIELVPFEKLKPSRALVATVSHGEFAKLTAKDLKPILEDRALVVDVKGMWEFKAISQAGFAYWSL